MKTIIGEGWTVLFQGDSVTDCGRDYGDDASLGWGYARAAAAMFSVLFPGHGVRFVNKGVGGNRVSDVLGRYDKDIRDVRPDLISILIGINDTWRRYDNNDPTEADEYERIYRLLLEKVKADLPNCKVMLMEPFVLNSLPDRHLWREDLDPKIQVVRKLAREYADIYMPLDGILAKAEVEEYDRAKIAEDGVHPTNIGHGIIAREYIRCVTSHF